MCNPKEIVVQGKRKLVCKRTGLPFVKHTQFGDFCEKECDIDARLFAAQRTSQWLEDMGPIFKREE